MNIEVVKYTHANLNQDTYMKKLILLSIALLSTSAMAAKLQLPPADYNCFDGKNLEVAIFVDGPVIEGATDDLILQPSKHRIVVRRGTEKFEYTRNVIAQTNGFGDDTFTALRNSIESIDTIASLYYGHEIGFLEGYVVVPNEDEYADKEYIYFSEENNMNCYDYTFDNLGR